MVTIQQLVILMALASLLMASSSSQDSITVFGGWSPWTKLETDCVKLNDSSGEVLMANVKCGGGVKRQTRSCTNPKPQGAVAKKCPGADVQSFPCNSDPCEMRWSSWSNCSESCARGSQRAYTECIIGNIKPSKDADLNDYEWKDCASIYEFENHAFEWIRDCNSWNRSTCPSACEGIECQDFAKCVDISTDTDKLYQCECQMGRVLLPETGQCIVPLPPPPTPRPIPVLEVEVKTATTYATRSASTVLIVFVGTTLILFAAFRIYDIARVIQMNMEIALICAHICLIMPDMTSRVEVCRIISILTHFFFLACFMFMFLEALHVYSMVASVVHKDGMFTKLQNILLGWGISAGILLISIALQYQHYGGKYHCWLQMDTHLIYAQFIPLIGLAILIFTLIEAAGNANYVNLPTASVEEEGEKVDNRQLTSAKIMQRTSVLIMPMVLATFIVGTFSEYNQDVYLYGIFTFLNGALGLMILVLHSSSNQTVRAVLTKAWNQIVKKE